MIAKQEFFKELAQENSIDFLTCNSRRAFGEVGTRCWTVDRYPYELPEGLADKIEAIVLRNQVGETEVVIQTADQKEWSLLRINLDFGMEYCIEGQWLKESEPLILKALQKQLQELPRRCHPRLQGHLTEALEYRQWRLNRWGKKSEESKRGRIRKNK